MEYYIRDTNGQYYNVHDMILVECTKEEAIKHSDYIIDSFYMELEKVEEKV